jgi:hypothetical protein
MKQVNSLLKNSNFVFLIVFSVIVVLFYPFYSVLLKEFKNTLREKPKSKDRNNINNPLVVKRMPINIATQGELTYKQLGILHDNNNTILPLMGRQTHHRSHMWNYYTLTNQNIPIRIPLVKGKRNCEDQVGCKELYNGDTIYIPEFSTTFTVKLYDRSPRYIPFL